MTIEPDSALVGEVRRSPNCEPRRAGQRPTMLLLHYTGVATCEAALRWLAEPASKVSCHYVIDADGRIVQMVPESLRAWHAGLSRWGAESDINSASIGIEIHNPGHDAGYPAFPPAQMEAVLALCCDIVRRRGLRPERVLAHSDVAPVRKKDPGEKFDWCVLARAGVGHWVEPAPAAPDDRGLGPGASGPAVARTQRLLAGYGYGVERTGVIDELTGYVVTAFQRHFRPARVDGRIDASTMATLERLVAALPARSAG